MDKQSDSVRQEFQPYLIFELQRVKLKADLIREDRVKWRPTIKYKCSTLVLIPHIKGNITK
jgi:hypothetical protein